MGWGLGHDSHWNRDIGYSVPAFCDHPSCWKEIDRGLSYVCASGEPCGGDGCGLYFCPDHKGYSAMVEDGDIVTISDCCERCRDGKVPFQPKSEHPTWLYWKIHHHSWKRWRQKCPEELAAAKNAWDMWEETAQQCLRVHYSLMQQNSHFWNDKGLREASKVLCVQASDIRQWMRDAAKEYEEEVSCESA